MAQNKIEISPPKLISSLRGYNLLPAIIFLSTRRSCDEAAMDVASDKSQKISEEKQLKRQEIYEGHLLEYPEVKFHKHRKLLLRAGIASHHAGHIPSWKLLIEKMMSAGLLEAIFATSTVAAGVDFPARSVVISQADTRSNDGWRPLKASELQQMTGRAGRRGKDNVGFCILAPSQFQNPKRIATLLRSQPDALQSQFRATYTSLLNLLDAYGSFARVREIAEKSFAFRETSHQIIKLEKESKERERLILERIKNSGLSFDSVRGFERLASTRLRLQSAPADTRFDSHYLWLKKNVITGRIISQGKSGRRFYLVIDVHGDKVYVIDDRGAGKTFELNRINRVYKKIYEISEDTFDQAFDEIFNNKNPEIKEKKVNQEDDFNSPDKIINDAIDRLLPGGLSEEEKKAAHQILWEGYSDAEFIDKTARDLDFLRNDIWLPFERRARVLDHFNYLDLASEKVTPEGKWLADLRIDRPLLVGEAMKNGLFANLEVNQAAALMASLAADPDRKFGEIPLSDGAWRIIDNFEKIMYSVEKIEISNNVLPSPEINLSAAGAAEFWADEANDWGDLVYKTKAEEGDLIRLLSRTGEALLQIAHLKNSQPEAAEIARNAAEIILREPIR